MSSQPFIHLHVHSEYSLLDGALRIPDALKKAAQMGMPALAITDHGALHGLVQFCQEAEKIGVKPILGCEIYLAPRRMADKDSRLDGDLSHLLLLVKDEVGYKNLIQIVSAASVEGFYRKPRVDLEYLSGHSEGLVALSGCLQGDVARLLLRKEEEAARQKAGRLAEVFGRDNFYVELMDNGLAEQKEALPLLLQLAEREGYPVVATNDVHYLNREDAVMQDILLCIQTKKTLSNPDRLSFSSDQFYLKSSEEMFTLFGEVPHALSNTLAISEMCEFKLAPSARLLMPDFPVPEGFDQGSYLRHLCEEGIRRRYKKPTPEIRERMEHELALLEQKGFVGYYLVTWDFVDHAKKSGILVGPGRGSGAGSLVAYLIGITELDPLKHGLIFERFLNPDRNNPPDFDVDFPDDKREAMIQYAMEKYGRENVAQVITFGTLAARAAVKDVGRALGLPYGFVDSISKLIPFQSTIEEALASVPDLRSSAESDPQVAQLLDYSRRLEGLVRHASTHAAGIVITPGPLTDHCPVQRSSEGSFVTTQYDMDSLKALGLIKTDFLAITTLTIIQKTLDEVRRRQGVEISLSEVPAEDKATYALLREGKTAGVFQLESAGMRELLQKIRPKKFEDIVAINALFRPGPMGRQDLFVQRRQGKAPVEYPHPLAEPTLKETYGVILYQEQVMRLASAVGGFTMAEADILVWAMGKKRREIMDNMRGRFIAGAVAKGVEEGVANSLYDDMALFGGYGFNKSHSAAYSLVAYYTAFLKANYPSEYMAALLSGEKDREKVAGYIQEARRMGSPVLPPHINESESDFSVTRDGSIRCGLAMIKGIGKTAVEEVLRARAGDPFSSVFDLCNRCDLSVVTKSVLEALVDCGALDLLGRRSVHRIVAPQALEAAQTARKQRQNGQNALFGLAEQSHLPEPVSLPDVPELSQQQLVALEKQYLGVSLSPPPPSEWAELLAGIVDCDTSSLPKTRSKTFTLAGTVTRKRSLTTKSNEPMMFFTLEDEKGSAEITVFPDAYGKYAHLINQGELVVIKGQIDSRAGKRVGEDMPKIICLEVLDIAGLADAGSGDKEKKANHAAASPQSVSNGFGRVAEESGEYPLLAPEDGRVLPQPAMPGPRDATAPAVLISLSESELTQEKLLQIRDLLVSRPGSSPVLLRVRRDDCRPLLLDLGPDARTGPAEAILADLRSLLGAGAITLTAREDCLASL